MSMNEKQARQEFEKLRNKVSKPPNMKEILERVDQLLQQRKMTSKQIVKAVVEEFKITQSLKGIRNYVQVRMHW